MKKLLFGILTLIGIGFSFCNAELFIKPSRSAQFGCASANSSYVNNSDFNKFYVNPSFDSIGIDTVCFSYGDGFGTWSNLDSIGYGVLGTGGDYKVMSNGAFWYFTGSTNCGNKEYVLCLDFSENPLVVGKNEVVQFGFHCHDYLVRTGYNWDTSCNNNSLAGSIYFYSQYQLNDIPIVGNYFSWPSGNIFAGMSNGRSMFAGIGYSEVQLNPTFKVNYGSTSYEYELDSDLSIYLKSPIVQSGNTFTYAGSTGINLFYNGSSQFYNKDKLYLSSMYWYNNNIFTPICL